MSAATPSPETVSLPVREMLVEYVQGRRLAEIIYQDTNGQVCLVHENIRDVLSRAGICPPEPFGMGLISARNG